MGHSVIEIIDILEKKFEGDNVINLCNENKINTSTLYRWEKQYGKVVMDHVRVKKDYEHLKKMYDGLLLTYECLYEMMIKNGKNE
ncbi:hypothetical protein [Pedobacter nototheniae]|uniref:hypothetical protein n=1 Tax=Pedobacter nototheniae TaxID=2488994 RepID=UPI00292CC4B5|nr:hypothetical protein [Pedobacter nototheniae]